MKPEALDTGDRGCSLLLRLETWRLHAESLMPVYTERLVSVGTAAALEPPTQPADLTHVSGFSLFHIQSIWDPSLFDDPARNRGRQVFVPKLLLWKCPHRYSRSALYSLLGVSQDAEFDNEF